MKLVDLQELLKKSYSPYSKFAVAAIAIDDKGNEYPGVNVENAAYPSGLCAERSALFGSVARGAKVGSFKEIHIISYLNDEVISPCAGCRQVMTEFMSDDSLVYQYSYDGKKVRINKISELIPFAVRSGDLFK
ncbi:cytidine deaminase [Mycoplasmopsis anatis]|uniref:Cytidine deaminase n=1 Tax=Mycoplasmopsis anatis TaxID=171279 RepID=A0A9Q3L950_9BACT|nr:cytidine deaminase [Mycoplasmopsis anatis]MBW0594811.1 cytidine deaminase [Mycoplasmopsis anatis]MBW0595421.1 cytidine deaminase [Mycoplasmopsis anatis]MBW0595844.1 cytidine deaminase [Mycoplasmopsis anatis]MBW0596748.1 cytidine deaminase [Mycoplasmopsis anatis]MBW0597237.1 cytidine deaminase [Mycoplasmopsis anatis]